MWTDHKITSEVSVLNIALKKRSKLELSSLSSLLLFFVFSFALGQTHTVVSGDTLAALAQRYNVSVADLMQLNNLSSTVIRIGQTLNISQTETSIPGLPPSLRLHTVQAGETWGSVAATYDLDVATLEAINPDLTAGAPLLPGGTLVIAPKHGVLVSLKAGQTLLDLALAYGLSPRDLVKLNGFADLSSLEAGQQVFVPVQDSLAGLRPQSSSTTGRKQLVERSLQLVSRAPQLLITYDPPAQGYLWPLATRGRISSRFGRRNISVRGNKYHVGVDIAAPSGTMVRATQGGVVSRSGWLGSYGYVVYLEHPSGAQTRYAHMRRVAVMRGQRVQQGESLGEVGSTGASTGPHLHFELRFNGYATDPLDYLEQ